MKRALWMLSLACVLVSWVAFPAMSQQVQQQKKPNWQKKIKENVESKFVISPATEKEFRQAVKSGDVDTVNRIVNAYPHKHLLRNSMANNAGKQVLPVCVATENGNSELVKYMLEKDGKLVEEKCGRWDMTPLDIAIENKKAATMLTLLSFKARSAYENVPLFVRIAQKFNDEAALRKLVPALLDAGYSPTEKIATDRSYTRYEDSLHRAARENNEGFVVAVSNALKQRGDKLVSHYTIWQCPDYHALGWGVSQKSLDDERARKKEEVEQSAAGKLLKSNGVRLDVYFENHDSSDCY